MRCRNKGGSLFVQESNSGKEMRGLQIWGVESEELSMDHEGVTRGDRGFAMLFEAGVLCRAGPLVAGAFYVLVAHCGGLVHAAESSVQSETFFALKNSA